MTIDTPFLPITASVQSRFSVDYTMNIFWSLSPREIIADYRSRSDIRRLVMGDCSNDGMAPLGLDQVQSAEKRHNFRAEDPKCRRIAPVPDQGNHQGN